MESLPFYNLIGGPLNACIRAQAEAAQTTVNFIKEVGLEEEKDGVTEAIYVHFTFVQNGRKVTISVPLLTIVPIPYIAINSIDIKFKATVPGGVKKFTVNITSTNNAFVNAIAAADATNLDLINPTEDNAIIFTVVPFPHGSELLGQTSIDFELSAAQDAIIAYPGVHTFTMKITDQNGCSKEIPVVMTVE